MSLSVLWNPISCDGHKVGTCEGKCIESVLRNVTFEVLQMLIPNEISEDLYNSLGYPKQLTRVQPRYQNRVGTLTAHGICSSLLEV